MFDGGSPGTKRTSRAFPDDPVHQKPKAGADGNGLLTSLEPESSTSSPIKEEE
jgi:hypothetical protein